MVDLSNSSEPVISVVVPAYNEQEVLFEFHRRTKAVLDDLNLSHEIIYVNDGSEDQTMDILRLLHESDSDVVVLSLSRNFGKEIAMTAGLEHVRGAATVVIDADLQDPPELIVDMVDRWRQGFEMVFARRTQRDGETFLKKITARLFYNTIRRISHVDVPTNTGDFRLMSRRVVQAVLSLPEHHRFMKGLFAWVGFSHIAVEYRRDPRFAGKSKWNYWTLWNYALEGLTAFTIAPLKIATYLGFVIALAAFGFAALIVYKTAMYGDPVHGYPSLMAVILFLGGVQLVFVGILGEYVGRTFNEAKRRPLYFVDELLRAESQIVVNDRRRGSIPNRTLVEPRYF